MQRLSEFFADNNHGIRPIARKAGIDPGLLWRYLNGDCVPGIDKADSLGDAIGLTGRQVREMAKADKMARELASARPGVA